MSVDWTAIGTAFATLGLIASGFWAAWQRRAKVQAETRASVADHDRDAAVADAQGAVYKMLLERVQTLENEVRAMRLENASERAHNRKLVLHIWKLEGLMRKAGIDPPPFIDGEASKAGLADA